MNVTTDHLRCAYHCAAEVIRSRRLSGAPIPEWLRRHYGQLDAAIRVSARGHESWPAAGDAATLGSAQVAEIVGRPDRWVRRHHADLSGVKVGDRWRFPRAAAERFAAERMPR